VAVKTSDNLFDYVDISVTGDTLHIRLRPFINFRFAQFHATVALPDLKVVDITGASYGAVSGFNSAGAVEVKVSGASRLDLSSLNSTDLLTEVSGASRLTGSLEAQKADFEVSGASTVELSGATENVRMEVSGASTARMDSLKTTNADITLSGASNATINVTGKLDLQVSGASRLVYTGSAVLGRAEVTGASTLTKR
jgi:hypothetical protein